MKPDRRARRPSSTQSTIGHVHPSLRGHDFEALLPRCDGSHSDSEADDGPDWLFEVKYDGFRSLAYIENGTCKLVSRNEYDYKRFAELRGRVNLDPSVTISKETYDRVQEALRGASLIVVTHEHQ